MAYRKFIASFLALLIISTNASAGFSSMRPPPGYSRAPSGATQQPGWGPSYKPAQGEFYDLGKQQWMTTASLNTGGRELTVPVAMPLATGAGVALAIATAFSSNPAILLGTAAWALYQAYLDQKDIIANSNGTFIQKKPGEANCEAFVGTPPAHSSVYGYAGWSESWGSYLSGEECMWGWTVTGPQGQTWKEHIQVVPKISSIKYEPLTPAQVSTEMANIPMNKPLIDALPMPLPVKSPVFNPNSEGAPKVLRVPQGSPSPLPLPSPNPNNLPQSWKTPVIDIVPSPTVDDPWRVEIIPKDIVKTDPSPLPDPFNPTAPLPTPVTPADSDPGTTETASTTPPGLCTEYPDILACAKPVFDTPQNPDLETRPREITYTPDSGWGSAGACPAARHLPGANVDFEFTLVCDFMSGIKPVLLTVASLVAGMIIIGARGGAAE